MPGDVQLTAQQVAAAPLTYTVPDSALVRLKAVNALFTDGGAAGDWLPPSSSFPTPGIPSPARSIRG